MVVVELLDLPVLPARPDFMDDGACADVPAKVFYPTSKVIDRETGLPLPDSSPWASEAAKAVCDDCPVRPECLDFALAHSGGVGRYGVWGGMTETERRKEARRRRAARAVQPARRAG